MTLPSSPTVVVLENDNSVYTPNVNSSVVGIVGFADKGPIDEATLVTSQNDLINKFGKPNSDIPGQGLEGALEILEATNQIYFVRTASASLPASSLVTLGFCPSVMVPLSGVSGNANTTTTSLVYTLIDNSNLTQAASKVISLASSTGYTTISAILLNTLSKDLTGDQDLIACLDSSGYILIAGKYAGASASLTLSSNTAWSLSAINNVGWASSVGGSGVFARGGTASAVPAISTSLYLEALSKYDGAGYNLSSLRDGSIQGISVEINSKSLKDQLVVNSDGSEKEKFDIELSPSSLQSIEYVLNTDDALNQSDLVNVSIKSNGTEYTGIPDNVADFLTSVKAFMWNGVIATTAAPRFIKPIEGTYSLAGGNSGYSTTEGGSLNDITALVGSSADKTGIHALDDDSLNISLALVPGITSQSVQNELITLAEESKNFVAIVSPPLGLDTVQDAVDWMNGKVTRTSPINNSYAAVYWPWVQVFNFYAGADEWYDPSIFAARQYVFTDNVAEPWFAPAGFRRGRLSKPVDVEVILNQGDRDALYVNNVNPITKEPQAGITIFGQKTAQRLPTALDRVNVRRLMIFIRKVLLQLGKPFQFEPNDEFTWERVEDTLNPFIDDLLNRRAIVEGAVTCDSTTNTPLRVDRNELWCSVAIKPTKAAETIVFEVNLTNQSAVING